MAGCCLSSRELEAQRLFPPLAPRIDSMRMLLVRPTEERDIGMVWDEVFVVDGKPDGVRLRRVYRTVNTLLGDHLDTVYSSVPDLKPLSHKAVAGVALEEITFRLDSIVGWVQRRGQKLKQVARATNPLTYDSHTFDLIVRRAPLREGLVISVDALLAPQDTVATLTATVRGSALVMVEQGQGVDAWVVALDFAGLKGTLWIEKGTHRLVRQELKLSDDISIVMDRLPRVPGEVRVRRQV